MMIPALIDNNNGSILDNPPYLLLLWNMINFKLINDPEFKIIKIQADSGKLTVIWKSMPTTDGCNLIDFFWIWYFNGTLVIHKNILDDKRFFMSSGTIQEMFEKASRKM